MSVPPVIRGIGADQNFIGRCVNALIKAARTGKVGDSKISVTPIECAVRIRTGETGDQAVQGVWTESMMI